jgi:hypothetical protein
VGPRVARRGGPRRARSRPPDRDEPLLHFEPVPHVASGRNSLTPDKQRAFIAALAASGIVTQAAREIGKSLEALEKLRQRPGAEEFPAAWDLALDRGMAGLEDRGRAQVLEGEEVPIVSAASCSASAAGTTARGPLFFLRQRRPGRYGPVPPVANLRRGRPLYERLPREWQDNDPEDEQAGLDSIDAMIDQIRERAAANAALLA